MRASIGPCIIYSRKRSGGAEAQGVASALGVAYGQALRPAVSPLQLDGRDGREVRTDAYYVA